MSVNVWGRARPPRWEDVADGEYLCPNCLHWWVLHGVPGEWGYGCDVPTSSPAERERGIYQTCDCTLAEGNPAKPRWPRIERD
jgi:hypothetical protein